MELGRGRLDKVVDLGKGVRANDVDGLEGGREGRGRCCARGVCEGCVGWGLGVCVGMYVAVVVSRGGGGGGGGGRGGGGGGVSSGGGWWLEVAGETGEDEHEEDEAVFAAIIGERELFNAVEYRQ